MSDAYIKQLYDTENDQVVYPVTTTDALYDGGGHTIAELIDGVQDDVDAAINMIGAESQTTEAGETTTQITAYTWEPSDVSSSTTVLWLSWSGGKSIEDYDRINITLNGVDLPPSTYAGARGRYITVTYDSFYYGDELIVYGIMETQAGESLEAHSVGDVVRLGNKEYRVIVDIAEGEAFVVGTNVEETTINDVLCAIPDFVVITGVVENVDGGQSQTGTLSSSDLINYGISDVSKYVIIAVNQGSTTGMMSEYYTRNNYVYPHASYTANSFGSGELYVDVFNPASTTRDIPFTVVLMKIA